MLLLLQTRIEESIQAAIDSSQQESRSIHVEIRPQFLVPDTNCFIDALQGIAALLAVKRFTIVVPLIGLLISLTHTHTHLFYGLLSGTTQVSQYQKGKTSLDFTEARDSEWQWHQLDHMQIFTLLQTDNHASALYHSSFLHAGCPSKHMYYSTVIDISNNIK